MSKQDMGKTRTFRGKTTDYELSIETESGNDEEYLHALVSKRTQIQSPVNEHKERLTKVDNELKSLKEQKKAMPNSKKKKAELEHRIKIIDATIPKLKKLKERLDQDTSISIHTLFAEGEKESIENEKITLKINEISTKIASSNDDSEKKSLKTEKTKFEVEKNSRNEVSELLVSLYVDYTEITNQQISNFIPKKIDSLNKELLFIKDEVLKKINKNIKKKKKIKEQIENKNRDKEDLKLKIERPSLLIKDLNLEIGSLKKITGNLLLKNTQYLETIKKEKGNDDDQLTTEEKNKKQQESFKNSASKSESFGKRKISIEDLNKEKKQILSTEELKKLHKSIIRFREEFFNARNESIEKKSKIIEKFSSLEKILIQQKIIVKNTSGGYSKEEGIEPLMKKELNEIDEILFDLNSEICKKLPDLLKSEEIKLQKITHKSQKIPEKKEEGKISKKEISEEKKEISFTKNLELKEEDLKLKDGSISTIKKAIEDIISFTTNANEKSISTLLRENNTVKELLLNKKLIETENKAVFKLTDGRLCTQDHTPDIENSQVKSKLNELLLKLKRKLTEKLEASKVTIEKTQLPSSKENTPSTAKEKSEYQLTEVNLRSSNHKNYHSEKKHSSEFAPVSSPVTHKRRGFERHNRTENPLEKNDITFTKQDIVGAKEDQRDKRLAEAKKHIQEFCKNIQLTGASRGFLLSRLIQNPDVRSMLEKRSIIDDKREINIKAIFKPRRISKINQELKERAIEAIAEPLEALAKNINNRPKEQEKPEEKKDSKKITFEKNNQPEKIRFEDAEEAEELVPKSMPFAKQDFVNSPEKDEISDQALLELYDKTLEFEEQLLSKEWKSDSVYKSKLFTEFLGKNKPIKIALEKNERYILSNQHNSIVNADKTINYKEIYPNHDENKTYEDIDRLSVRRILDQLIYWLPSTIKSKYDGKISEIEAKYPKRLNDYVRQNRTIEEPEYEEHTNGSALSAVRPKQAQPDLSTSDEKKQTSSTSEKYQPPKDSLEDSSKLTAKSIIFTRNDFRKDLEKSPEITDREFIVLYENTLRFACSLTDKEWNKSNSNYKDYFFENL